MRQIAIPALVLGVAAASLAQEAPAEKPKTTEARAEAKPARIAIIDMGRVSSETLLGKGYAAELEKLKAEIDAEGTKKQSQLQKLDADIKALQDELEKQASVLSPDAAEKRGQDIKKKQRERQAFLEDGQAELERMRQRAQQQAQVFNGEFQQRIRPSVEAVAKERGIDILLDSQVTLTVNKTFDVSQDVIVKADDAERAARSKAAAKPAEKPAEKPAPKPAPAPSPSPKP